MKGFWVACGFVVCVVLCVPWPIVSAEDSANEAVPGMGFGGIESGLLITGASIIDPAVGSASAPRDILIVDGRITAVEDAGGIPQNRAATVFSAQGKFALPGLIDVHAHLGDGGLGKQSEQDREAALLQFLRYGVTTIFIPGGGGGNDDQLARWKERRQAGELPGPGIYGSGALITAPGSHPIGTIWNLPDDVDPAVVYQRGAVAIAEEEPVGPLLDGKLALGADAIKIIIEDGIGPRYPMPRLSNAKISELVEASHERGLRVFAHVSMPGHVADGVAGGIDGIMHSVEEAIPDEVFSRMAQERIFYVATLALYDGFFDLAHGRFEQELYAEMGVSKRALESLRGFRGTPFQSAEVASVVEAAVQDNLRRAAAAGVPLALGTDVNNPQVFPGYSVHEELALMVEAGLSPAQALAAATTGGASFLEKETSLGRIAPGYEADLLILTKNPLESILNSRSLAAVVNDGRIVDDVVSQEGIGPDPIIDMHLHAFGWDEYGDPPPPNEITGKQPAARSDDEAMEATLLEMARHGIVMGVASGPLDQVLRWRRAAPDRILGGVYTGSRDALPDLARLRELFDSGEIAVLGELGLQYQGLAATDESMRGYFALAEELDVPVALHTGLGDEGTPYGCCPDFRVELGRPSLIEEVLVRHPRLRLYLMHAGYPFLEEVKALLYVYPQLYVDIAVINWALPRGEFHGYLRALVEAGFSDRILFGSDQMVWPEAIGMAIEGVESAPFLSYEQKRDIYFRNAVRFLRLPAEEVARLRRQTRR
ncbi:MAG: amidohydrolase family protein [Deltaproteobacteria bacterium]|nr:amidohydrolase family protein [Deltaproteobacteria bacterium]